MIENFSSKDNRISNTSKTLEYVTNLPTKSNQPFPEIVGSVKDMKTILVLKNLVYSRNSELTAIMTYLYQHFQSQVKDAGIADILGRIAEVEMTHLDALSRAIIAFGGDPNYINSNMMPWNIRYVDFKANSELFLKRNILAEECAIGDYEKAIILVNNESLKNLFRKIILDEKTHILIFEDVLKYLNQQE